MTGAINRLRQAGIGICIDFIKHHHFYGFISSSYFLKSFGFTTVICSSNPGWEYLQHAITRSDSLNSSRVDLNDSTGDAVIS